MSEEDLKKEAPLDGRTAFSRTPEAPEKRVPVDPEDVRLPNEGDEFTDSRGYRYVRENGKRMLYIPGRRNAKQLPELPPPGAGNPGEEPQDVFDLSDER